MSQSPVTVDSYPLELVQAKTCRWRFAWRQSTNVYANLNNFNLFAQIRSAEKRDADLLLNLTPFLTIADSDDQVPVVGKYVWLTLPGNATAGLEAGPFNSGRAAWDLFAVTKTDPHDDYLLVQGGVSMDPSVTDMVASEV